MRLVDPNLPLGQKIYGYTFFGLMLVGVLVLSGLTIFKSIQDFGGSIEASEDPTTIVRDAFNEQFPQENEE